MEQVQTRTVDVVSNNTDLVVATETIEIVEGVNVISKAYEMLTRKLGINTMTARMNYHVKSK